MSPTAMLTEWTRTVQCLLPSLHAYQQRTLAAFSFGIARALRCHLSRAALRVPGPAAPRSTERRFQRCLANGRIDVPAGCGEFARQVLSAWTNRRLLLVLDEVPLGNRLRCLRVSACYQGRALPLVWRCYPPDAPPRPMPDLVRHLIRRAAACVPPGAEVILLADRGLSWPQTLDACRGAGWHFILRLQRDVRVRFPDGSECPVVSLLREGERPVYRRSGLDLFKDAGWKPANLVCVWRGPDRDAWMLATDLPPTPAACSLYRRRTWFEEGNRDEKSYGFDWQKSRVWRADHAERLLLVMALAMLWLLSLGYQLLRSGQRTRFEPRGRRLYSLFQLGWRWMEWALLRGDPVPTLLCFYPPPVIRSLPP